MSIPLSPMVTRDAVIREALSAQPGAPVQEYVEPAARTTRRSRRTRTALAGVLQRAADAVAPAEHCPAR